MTIRVWDGEREGFEGTKVYILPGSMNLTIAKTCICKMRKMNLKRINEFEAFEGVVKGDKLWKKGEVKGGEKVVAVYRIKESLRSR